jgi:anti-anti-sigma factor
MASFFRDGERLTITGRLEMEDEKELKEHAAALLKLPEKEVTIDLSAATGITSVCIGVLVAAWLDLREAEKQLALQASAEVRSILDMTGLAKLMGVKG